MFEVVVCTIHRDTEKVLLTSRRQQRLLLEIAYLHFHIVITLNWVTCPKVLHFIDRRWFVVSKKY